MPIKFRELYRKHPWRILTTAYVGLSILGYVGFGEYVAQHRMLGDRITLSVMDKLYMTIQLLTLESGGFSGSISNPIPWQLEMARFLLPVLTILAFIRIILKIASKELEQMFPKQLTEHIVICGLGHQGRQLALSEVNNNKKIGKQENKGKIKNIVVIERDESNPYIEELRDEKVRVIIGDACDRDRLKDASVETAAQLVAATADDATNIRIVRIVNNILAERMARTPQPSKSENTKPLPCHIHLSDTGLSEILEYDPDFGPCSRISLHYFNVYEQNARALFKDLFCKDPYAVLRRVSRPDDPPLHFIVFGQTLIGEEITHQIALLGHFASSRSTLLTMVGDNQSVLEQDRMRYEVLESEQPLISYKSVHVLWDNLRTIHFENIFKSTADLVFVCRETEMESLLLANQIREYFKSDMPYIVIGCEKLGGLSDELSATLKKRNIITFSKIGKIDMVLDQAEPDALAKLIHENYRKNPSNQENRSWWELTNEEKTANRLSADHLLLKLWTIDSDIHRVASEMLTVEQEKLLEEMEHKRWCAQKYLDGWRYTPGEKDWGKHTNPLLKQFKDLTLLENDNNKRMVAQICELCLKYEESLR